MSLKIKLKNLLERVGKIMFRSQDKTLNGIKKELKQQQKLLTQQQNLIAQQQEALDRLQSQLLRQRNESLMLRNAVNTLRPKLPSEAHPQIIVSITSYPARIGCVADVVENMLAQTVLPDKIVLTLSEENFPNKEADLPIRLLRHRANGLELLWVKDDLRSFKKLFPIRKLYADDIIITVDDDLVYSNSMIEQLCEAHRQFPTALCGMRTHLIKTDSDGTILPYKTWEKHSPAFLLQPRWDLFATTGAGTLFPPHVFGEEFFDESLFLRLCPTSDDMWVKFMCMKYNVPVVLSAPPQPLEYLPDTQKERLFTVNKRTNDSQFAALTEHFGEEMWEKLKTQP